MVRWGRGRRQGQCWVTPRTLLSVDTRPSELADSLLLFFGTGAEVHNRRHMYTAEAFGHSGAPAIRDL